MFYIFLKDGGLTAHVLALGTCLLAIVVESFLILPQFWRGVRGFKFAGSAMSVEKCGTVQENFPLQVKSYKFCCCELQTFATVSIW